MSIPSRLNVPGEGKLLVAFSGGSDSLYLLYVLSLQAKDRTTALYVDHNLRSREELDREIALNQKNAAALGIPLVIKTIPSGEIYQLAKEKDCGIEAAARELRYSILCAYAEEHSFSAILTAHHREDQVETLLMRMLNGSPFWTWGGIASQNKMLLRPILFTKKEEILRVLDEQKLEFSVDSTNQDLSFKRNFIRQKLVSCLSEDEKENLCSIAENVTAFNKNLRSIPFKRGFWCEFPTQTFLSAFPQQQERLLFEVFSGLEKKARVTRRFIQSVVEKASESRGRLEAYGLVFYFLPDVVKVYRRLEAFSVPFDGENTILPCNLAVNMSTSTPLTLQIPSEYLEGSVVRLARSGDIIELCSGMRHVSDFGKEYRHPQSLVIEQDGTIVAILNSVFGGRDRLFASALGKKGKKISVILRNKAN